ncbi:9741_t:CDS:1, partial [Ambispora leptoticha]
NISNPHPDELVNDLIDKIIGRTNQKNKLDNHDMLVNNSINKAIKHTNQAPELQEAENIYYSYSESFSSNSSNLKNIELNYSEQRIFINNALET